jgi:hypothetical protein
MAYLSRRLLDAEVHIRGKAFFTLYYACTKCQHYLLSSTCMVVSQHDVLKCMLQRPILSGRLGKWAYALVEFDLKFEPLKAMKGQVLADFIVDHGVEPSRDECMVKEDQWEMYFDESVCSKDEALGVSLCHLMG